MVSGKHFMLTMFSLVHKISENIFHETNEALRNSWNHVKITERTHKECKKENCIKTSSKHIWYVIMWHSSSIILHNKEPQSWEFTLLKAISNCHLSANLYKRVDHMHRALGYVMVGGGSFVTQPFNCFFFLKEICFHNSNPWWSDHKGASLPRPLVHSNTI